MTQTIVSQLPSVVLVVASATASIAPTTSFTVAAWNVESGGADVHVIADRIGRIDGVDVWGLCEVQSREWVDRFETAAEAGEDADFASLMGTTGGGDALAILYDDDRFDLVAHQELHDINPGGRVRSPLVARLRETDTAREFLFVVNHLYRSNDEARHDQARRLNDWAELQTLPVIAVGDFNFDWHVEHGDERHDAGYDRLVEDDVFKWVRPESLIKTQSSERYNSVLDFVFVAGPAKAWTSHSTILVEPADFPDGDLKPDHRPLMATFDPDATSVDPTGNDVLKRLDALEREVKELRRLVESMRDE